MTKPAINDEENQVELAETVTLPTVVPIESLTPLPGLESLLATATILSYYGFSLTCRELMFELSRKTRRYAEEKKDKLTGFIAQGIGAPKRSLTYLMRLPEKKLW